MAGLVTSTQRSAAASRSLDFLADAVGPMAAAFGDWWEMPLPGGPGDAATKPGVRRLGLDAAGRPCYSRLMCGTPVAAAPALSN